MFLSLLAVLPESIPGCSRYYSQEGSYGLDSSGGHCAFVGREGRVAVEIWMSEFVILNYVKLFRINLRHFSWKIKMVSPGCSPKKIITKMKLTLWTNWCSETYSPCFLLYVQSWILKYCQPFFKPWGFKARIHLWIICLLEHVFLNWFHLMT